MRSRTRHSGNGNGIPLSLGACNPDLVDLGEGSPFDPYTSLAVKVRTKNTSRDKQIEELQKTITYWKGEVSTLESQLQGTLSRGSKSRLRSQLNQAKAQVVERERRLEILESS